MYNPPKAVVNHPAVKSCTSGYETGADQKHYVELKDGYWFGPMYQTSSLFFETVNGDRSKGRRWNDYVNRIVKKENGQ